MKGLIDTYAESVIQAFTEVRPKYIPGPSHPWRQYGVKIKSSGKT